MLRNLRSALRIQHPKILVRNILSFSGDTLINRKFTGILFCQKKSIDTPELFKRTYKSTAKGQIYSTHLLSPAVSLGTPSSSYRSSTIKFFSDKTQNVPSVSKQNISITDSDSEHLESEDGSSAVSDVSSTSTEGEEIQPGHEDGHFLMSAYWGLFKSPEEKSNLNVFDLRSGTYYELSDAEIEKYFPEGLAGHADQEFEETSSKKWMVRDTSKLVMRYIDTMEKQLKHSGHKSVNAAIDNRVLHSAAHVERLTDRMEWDSATPQFSRYGHELAGRSSILKSKPESSGGEGGEDEEEEFVISNGPGSFVDETMKNLTSEEIPNKLVLTGTRGSGKSMILNQAVFHARQRGWLCLFVPKGWDQVQSGPYVDPIPKSDQEQTLYDNPIMTNVVMRGFWKAHREQLKNIPITNTEALKKYEGPLAIFRKAWNQALSVQGRSKLPFIAMRAIVQEEDHFEPEDSLDEPLLKNFDIMKFELKTLEHLVLLGVALKNLAGLAFIDLVHELRNHESTPVLIVVDQYNTWQAKSAFSYDGKPLLGNQLCVPHSLSFLSRKKHETASWTIKNGVCIAATSLHHPEGSRFTYEDVKPSLPLRLRVPVYNQVEYLSAMSFYINFAYLDTSVTIEDILEYRLHTASIPRLVRGELTDFFVPRSMEAHADDFLMDDLMDDDDEAGDEDEVEEEEGPEAKEGDGDESEDDTKKKKSKPSKSK